MTGRTWHLTALRPWHNRAAIDRVGRCRTSPTRSSASFSRGFGSAIVAAAIHRCARPRQLQQRRRVCCQRRRDVDGQALARHGLLGPFAIEAVELVEAVRTTTSRDGVTVPSAAGRCNRPGLHRTRPATGALGFLRPAEVRPAPRVPLGRRRRLVMIFAQRCRLASKPTRPFQAPRQLAAVALSLALLLSRSGRQVDIAVSVLAGQPMRAVTPIRRSCDVPAVRESVARTARMRRAATRAALRCRP